MAAIVAQEEQPISRTYQYRKVMKPMLERKRRARINRCLDELKELLVGALQAEGESVSRLEKADVLELTVRHLHKLRRSQQLNDTGSADKFKAGFVQCANEVSKYMTTVSGSVDISVSSRLLSHLDGCIRHIDNVVLPVGHHPGASSPPTSMLSPVSSTSSSSSGGSLNILTSYTPPASPCGSPKNGLSAAAAAAAAAVAHLNGSAAAAASSPASLLNHHAKLFGYNGYATPLQTLRGLYAASAAAAQAHHHQQQIAAAAGGHPSEEPFDLSRDGVWRPW